MEGSARVANGVIAPPYWDRACRELAARDPVLQRLIEAHRHEVLRGSGDGFRTLLNAVIGQQISVAAAAGIRRRFLEAFPGLDAARLPGAEAAAPAGGDSVVLSEAIAEAEEDTLRRIGLSRRKTEYVRGIAAAFACGDLDPKRWPGLSDDEVRHRLTQLRGVGPWTADMVLIFHERRPDVLPLGDIGLVNAAARLYAWDEEAPGEAQPGSNRGDAGRASASRTDVLHWKRERLRAHAELWRPWRTVATWYIWRDLDVEPVIY